MYVAKLLKLSHLIVVIAFHLTMKRIYGNVTWKIVDSYHLQSSFVKTAVKVKGNE